jgi:ABC-type phosphate/phosphonate transport system substrate-binding protein
VWALAWTVAGGAALAGQTGERLTFIGVALDAPTRQADQRLTEYLLGKTGIGFAREELEYEQVITRLVNWRPEDGLFVARTTPYAYVVAELLGAAVEPLATYVSATTSQTTYRSYFVVNRQAFRAPPDLAELVRFLQQRTPRARFVYQSQFSTSSFFLPSLFFRSHRIFHMPESTGPLTAMAAEKRADASSATLVDLVARGDADVAAVWDGVKARFEPGGVHAAAGQRVYFVALPTPMPNDLLVTSAGLDAATKQRLRDAIGAMRPAEIGVGDFRTWQNIHEATDARLALGDLRQLAREGVAPVTVEIRHDGRDAPAAAGGLVEAARQAVRLSETEFVLFDADFHEHPDFRWTIAPIHDGAALLKSAIPGAEVDEQSFQLSFRDLEDLTSRIVALIQTRVHRIRYVWPYSAGAPIVIRDSAFALPAGTPVKVQRVTWIDPPRNQFRAGPIVPSRIERASFYRYELPADLFRRDEEARPDPLSNVALRVILERPSTQPWLFRALTVLLVACFVLAGVAAGWAVIKRPSLRPTSSSPSGR